jgi:ribonucleoside-triphosphate reductase
MAIAEATNLHPEDLAAEATFRLTPAFLKRYKDRRPPFGFNGLGELVYMRTYSRIKKDGQNEVWWETVRRVVEGTYRMQERHIKAHDLGWDSKKAQQSAQEMFERMFSMKFLPPGRGLWAMGSELTETRGLFAALNNCAFRTTGNIDTEGAEPFCWLMDASMLGIGVGFDVKGAGLVEIKQALTCQGDTFTIPDTREGWVESVRILINSFLDGTRLPWFIYDGIRPAGVPIKGFGGVASGPEPLLALHSALVRVLQANVGRPITTTTIVDLMNLIGKCVVAGNVRRTAEIVFGQPDDPEYLSLKDHWWNPLLGEIDPATGKRPGGYDGAAADRADWSWTSNNSVFCEVGQDYALVAAQTAVNGEPGFAWLSNMQAYGRMGDGVDFRDHRAAGGNPCLEQTLEDQELCCLVETFPNNHETLEDYHRTLKFAYLYAKTVTLGKTHWPGTNRVMLRNRRIGTSMSGVQQFIAGRGLEQFRRWCEDGYETIQSYDRIYSDWFAVPLSIKTTSIKPSGTVSLLAGATPGCHWPEALHYLRRMRLSVHSDLVAPLKAAGYALEPAVGSEDTTLVVAVPVKIDAAGGRLRTVGQVSMWEQVAMAAFLQEYWADNQVSCTVTFRPEEGPQIAHALDYFQYRLKGISFLPRLEKGGKFAQMPYEEITADVYEAMVADLKPLEFGQVTGEEADVERFCDGDKCQL